MLKVSGRTCQMDDGTTTTAMRDRGKRGWSEPRRRRNLLTILYARARRRRARLGVVVRIRPADVRLSYVLGRDLSRTFFRGQMRSRVSRHSSRRFRTKPKHNRHIAATRGPYAEASPGGLFHETFRDCHCDPYPDHRDRLDSSPSFSHDTSV